MSNTASMNVGDILHGGKTSDRAGVVVSTTTDDQVKLNISGCNGGPWGNYNLTKEQAIRTVASLREATETGTVPSDHQIGPVNIVKVDTGLDNFAVWVQIGSNRERPLTMSAVLTLARAIELMLIELNKPKTPKFEQVFENVVSHRSDARSKVTITVTEDKTVQIQAADCRGQVRTNKQISTAHANDLARFLRQLVGATSRETMPKDRSHCWNSYLMAHNMEYGSRAKMEIQGMMDHVWIETSMLRQLADALNQAAAVASL